MKIVSDIQGKVIEMYAYDSFGRIYERNGISANYRPFQTSRVNHNRFFTNREYDTDLQLYYYRARWYSPALGRFMSRDPLGYSEGVNLYAYVGNNPTTFTDPWGLSIKPFCSSYDQPVVTINEGKPEQFLPPTLAQNIWNNSVVQTLITEDLENFYVNCFAQEQVCSGRCDKTECVVSVISTINPASKAGRTGIKGVNIIKNRSDNVVDSMSKKVVKSIDNILKQKNVQDTLKRIEKNAPSVKGDGKIFRDDFGKLPKQSDSNYYTEWNVATPGVNGPGAQRIVKGKKGELYYTNDHYDTFTQIK